MISGGRGFRARGGGRGGGGGGRFLGRAMNRMENRPVEPIGPKDPRGLVSYNDVDAPKEKTIDVDYGNAFPSRPKKKRKVSS